MLSTSADARGKKRDALVVDIRIRVLHCIAFRPEDFTSTICVPRTTYLAEILPWGLANSPRARLTLTPYSLTLHHEPHVINPEPRTLHLLEPLLIDP
jgi:hypothetical protein